MQLDLFPDIRYAHDADELRRLGDWLDVLRSDAAPHDVARDYLLLSDRLYQLAEQAREFARERLEPIP
jgi:hypothetical protein